MAIPSSIRAGDSVRWTQPPTVDLIGAVASSDAWTGTTYLRFNASGEAITVTASADAGGGWVYNLPAATSSGMDAGVWYFQTVISKGADQITTATGRTEVLASLGYSGTAGAFDGRTQLQKDLEAVQGAIRAIVAGGAVKQYTIGTRSLTKCSLAELMQLEAKLKAELARERKAEAIRNGLGNPHNLFVRFG